MSRLIDPFQRSINYLRISVTDRCNLRCKYCMPEDGLIMMEHKDILSFEEIVRFTEIAVSLGIKKIRLTGGEPLVRKNIIQLIKMLADIKGIDDFGMTTNGTLLTRYAEPLKKAGLHRINVSLDTVDADQFRTITRGGDINTVFDGIAKAKSVGFDVIKVNCVIKKSSTEPNAQAVALYCEENGLKARFIREMDLEAGKYWVVEGGSGGDCKNCSRLRLTSNGQLKPCLINDLSYDIREIGFEEAILKAVSCKPQKGVFTKINKFHSIGG